MAVGSAAGQFHGQHRPWLEWLADFVTDKNPRDCQPARGPSCWPKVKLLNATEMLELVEATDADAVHLSDRMRPVRFDDQPDAWVAEGVKNGHYKLTTILHHGKRVGCFWWWFSPGNKALVVNAGASFTQDDTFECFLVSFSRLAKKIGAESVQIQTRRPGLIRKFMHDGWNIDGVCMSKNLKPIVL